MNGDFFKYLILPLGLFLASIAVIFWVLLPLYQDTQAALAVKAQNLENLAQRQKLTANLAGLIEQYNGRAADIANFNKVIPSGQNIPELLANLEALAIENNLFLSGVEFKPKDLRVITTIKPLVIELKVVGSYPSFQGYLRAVEKNLRFFDAAAISFSGVAPGQTGAKIDQLEFNVTINTYFQ